MERKDPVFTGWAQRGAFAELKPVVATDPPPEPPAPPPPVDPVRPLPAGGVFLHFADRPGLLRLLLRNLGLNLLTLGFYRFWGRTRLRRHLWGRTELLGDPLEYTGTGFELFRGFAIATVILVGLSLLLEVMSIYLGGGSAGSASFGFTYLFLLGLFAARAYRLSRTRWRGIRFLQALSPDGLKVPLIQRRRHREAADYWTLPRRAGFSSASLLVVRVMWPLLAAIFTLGFMWPYYRFRLRQEMHRATNIGDLAFRCEGSWRPLFLPWLAAMFTLGLAYPWYRVREFRHLVACTSLNGARFTSTLETGFVYRRLGLALLALLGLAAAYLVLLFAILAAVQVTSGLPDARALPGPVALLLIGAVVLVWLQPAGTLVWLLLRVPILRQVCATLSVSDATVFDAAGQVAHDISRSGEGLGEALGAG